MFPPSKRVQYIDMLKRMKWFYDKNLAVAA